ncbi:MAG: hypothetical protein C4520_10675 [Candidatus Abyssobacteria bacterium SURF_5]|uniref:Uncharacterized protein n=1 Tax=Abyssobacteria bacterium (strain SURF_5) TaxID=2093360 RepID=A0A3A4NZA9_ABYX5|nr:MAG: hypothetical protein C4520_10675 [Candidatus Abyssubacteria bacterium SURF_5]
MVQPRVIWKKCGKRSGFARKLMLLNKLMLALLLIGLWSMHAGTVKGQPDQEQPNRVLVGDSYAVFLAQLTGSQYCGEAGATFDEIVSVILDCPDWSGKEAHLLWGVAHSARGAQREVVETEISLLTHLLKEKGVQEVVAFTLEEMLAVLEESEENRQDELHLNLRGYRELYKRKGLSLENEWKRQSISRLLRMYRQELSAVGFSLREIVGLG